MSGGLDMDVDATSYQIKVLSALGDDLARASQSARANVDSLSGTLGKGPMGARFAKGYEPGRTSLEQQIDTCRQRTVDLAHAGQYCVDVYATADAHAEAEMLSVRFK